MPTEILMPALSPTMEEGTLAKWLVKEGDEVRSGDPLAEIETDKATMEFEAADDGVVGRLLVEAGTEHVKVNAPIAVLLGEGESVEDIEKTSPAQPISAQETAEQEAPPPAAVEHVSKPKGSRVFASPLAKRIAAEKGIDLSLVQGSGPRGRIVKADLEGVTEKPSRTAAVAAPAAASPSSPPAAPSAFPAGPGADAVLKTYANRPHKEVTLDGMRKTIAARLTEAKQTIPHFYLRRDIRIDSLLDLRSQLNSQLAARNVKLSVNDFVIKACALALQSVPEANAVWAGDRILQLEPSDVAVAVAVDGGLFTPVIADAETKSLSTLSTEMKDLATRARDRKLAPHEYQGGSFAISNLGMFGIDNFDAVINPPHGGILAVGAGVKKPVVAENGTITVATVMSVTLSVDHRVIDGAIGARLLQQIVGHLENPLAMLA